MYINFKQFYIFSHFHSWLISLIYSSYLVCLQALLFLFLFFIFFFLSIVYVPNANIKVLYTYIFKINEDALVM